MNTDRATKIAEFVAAAHAAGRTVYFQTHLRTIKLAPKHANLARVRNGHYEVLMGKQGWVSVHLASRITAQ